MNRVTHIGLIALILCLVETSVFAMILSGEVPHGDTYYDYDGNVYLAGSRTNFTADSFSLWDRDYDDVSQSMRYDTLEQNCPRWFSAYGSFPFGNRGLGVTWQAPDSEHLDFEVNFWVHDLPATGFFDDVQPRFATKIFDVNVIVPYVDDVTFTSKPGQSNAHAITGISDPEWSWISGTTYKNEPACYTKNTNLCVSMRFTRALPLSQSETIDVRAESIGTSFGSSIKTGVSASANQYSYTEGTASSLSGSATLPNEIGGNDDYLQFEYRVPDGSGNWISFQDDTSGPHKVYTVYGAPSCESYNYLKNHIAWACTNASGSDTRKEIADDIHSALDANPPYDGDGDTQTDDWYLLNGLPYRGECDEQARFMVRILNLIGVSGSSWDNIYASNDTTYTDQDSDTIGGTTYWLKFDFSGNGVVDNHFEAFVEVPTNDAQTTFHYYTVWPSLEASSVCLLWRKVGPDSEYANQIWISSPDGSWIGAWQTPSLSEYEPYHSCN